MLKKQLEVVRAYIKAADAYGPESVNFGAYNAAYRKAARLASIKYRMSFVDGLQYVAKYIDTLR